MHFQFCFVAGVWSLLFNTYRGLHTEEDILTSLNYLPTVFQWGIRNIYADRQETFKLSFSVDDFLLLPLLRVILLLYHTYFQFLLSPLPELSSIHYTLSSFHPECFSLYIWAKNEGIIGPISWLQTRSLLLRFTKVWKFNRCRITTTKRGSGCHPTPATVNNFSLK